MRIINLFINRCFIFFSILFVISCGNGNEPVFDAVKYVDPQIGSVHGRWFFYTPGAVPFGMAKLGPHTNAYGRTGGWEPGGYDDQQHLIEGFGHFHEFQIGGVVVMPLTGDLQTVPGPPDRPDDGYRSRFEKNEEISEPGYYSVLLKDYGVKAEITATPRVGFHRYTFPTGKNGWLIFDIGHKQGESGEVKEARAKWDGNYEVEGQVVTYPGYAVFCDPGKYVKMYFVARLSKRPSGSGAFVNEKTFPGLTETIGTDNGLYFEFPASNEAKVEMQVGLSYTSVENARNNLNVESKNIDFDEVRIKARNEWNEKLSEIKVEGGRESDRKKFYTGLYHALLGRGLASDVNGQYPMNNGGIGQIPLDKEGNPIYSHYNTDGIWGGFWNLSQVWALACPDYFAEYVQSNIDFYKETGWLHDGVAAGVFTNGVQTNFQGLLIASAYNCGIRNFDIKTGYEAALKNEVVGGGRNLGNGKYDLSWFLRLGYVPYQDTVISNGWRFNFGASHTLEYCFSSFAVAQMAKQLGKIDDFERLMKLSANWKNIFDHETGFIRPKLPDGKFINSFDPMKAWDGFQEGNAFQYTWYVPHDLEGLIDAVGKERFSSRLEEMFTNAQKSVFGGGKELHSFSGVEKLYNHGNQPCLHDAWLFNYIGKPWLTQKWTRAICNEFYGTEPLHGYGYGQDEDQGQLGAWYVMAALGLFDVQGHASENPVYQVGSPIFDRATVNLPGNRKLVIETKNNSPENIYTKEIKLNGKKINTCSVYRKDLVKGGKLEITMSSVPNEETAK